MSEYKKTSTHSRFFDYKFTKNMMKLTEVNPFYAIEEIKKYLDEYKYDYNLMSAYISLLITVGKFEEAKKANEEMKQGLKDDAVIQRKYNEYFYEKYLNNTKFYDFRILSNNGDLKNAYDLLMKYKDDFEENRFSFASVIFYYRTRLGEQLNRDEQPYYITKQMVEYKEEDFFEHIKRHIRGTEECNYEKSQFYEDLDFKRIYDEIMRVLHDQKPLYKGFFERNYYFKYDNCGTDGSNYIRFITLGDGLGAITMYPSIEGDELPHYDLNYLKEEKEMVRTRSQIDRFNKRFGRK